jgi:hypothetical protein
MICPPLWFWKGCPSLITFRVSTGGVDAAEYSAMVLTHRHRSEACEAHSGCTHPHSCAGGQVSGFRDESQVYET